MPRAHSRCTKRLEVDGGLTKRQLLKQLREIFCSQIATSFLETDAFARKFACSGRVENGGVIAVKRAKVAYGQRLCLINAPRIDLIA